MNRGWVDDRIWDGRVCMASERRRTVSDSVVVRESIRQEWHDVVNRVVVISSTTTRAEEDQEDHAAERNSER